MTATFVLRRGDVCGVVRRHAGRDQAQFGGALR